MATKQKVLLDMNIRWLRQALELLDRLDDARYAASPSGFAPHCAGGHLRHIVEFYRCFLDGIESLHIDYDSRRRDATIEKSRTAAVAAIESIIGRLENCAELRADATIWVRMEDAMAYDLRDSFIVSSTTRELQVLSSHTIHHFALMALTLRLHGVEMDPAFGMAPSTLRYLASREAAA
jgi:hypothetical protein